jgi:hypothetical protein
MYQQCQSEINRMAARLSSDATDQGAFFLSDGYLLGFEFFDSHLTWHRTLPALITSYGLEALINSRSTVEIELTNDATELLDRVRHGVVRSYSSLGLGRDLRLGGCGICGAATLWRNRIVHFLAFSR